MGVTLYYLFIPIIRMLARRRVPRAVSACLLLVSSLVALSFALSTLLPRLYEELRAFASQVPVYVGQIEELADQRGFGAILGEQAMRAQLERFQRWALGGAGWILTQGLQMVNLLVSLLLGTMLFVYLASGGEELASGAAAWLPASIRERSVRFGRAASRLVAGYIRARILASLFIGLSYWFAFQLLGLRQAVLLAVVGGTLNLIPLIGPLIASAPVLLIASAQSWSAAATVLIVMFGAQQLESGILDPLLAGRYVRLPPVIVIVAVACGGALLGIPGMLVAVPTTAILREALIVFYRDGDRLVSCDTAPPHRSCLP